MVSSLAPEQIREYRHQPAAVRKLIRDALDLTKKNLTYLYGSNTPKRGGMDCSGTVQYILQNQDLSAVPRQADQIHSWLRQRGKLNRVTGRSLESQEFGELKPGDLLFWSGTYKIDRDVTHVMIYLGTDKTTGKPVMVGASDGRRYNGLKRRGVSVFDFRLPRAGSKARFVGYGSIPGLIAAQPDTPGKKNDDTNDGSSLVF
jgi:cell wall-associated NlpC family hydrolase